MLMVHYFIRQIKVIVLMSLESVGLMDIEGVCLAKIGAMIANYIHTIP